MDEQTTRSTRRAGLNYLPLFLLLVAGIALVAGGIGVMQGYQLHEVRRELGSSQQDTSTLLARMQDTNEALRREIADLRTRLAADEEKAQAVVAEQTVAAPTPEQTAARRRAVAANKRAQSEQQAKIKALEDELAKVSKSSEENSAKLATVSSDVTDVKGQVASTRSDLEKTASDMKSVRGDMGVMSGLIATNEKEIDQLRRLGERNIYEFTITTDDGEHKVGDILMKLEKANVKHNRYSVVINADDRRIEKKDKTTNEPVQFYVPSKARQPYEIVVNEVSKRTIKGYLATPKVTISRQAAVE